jgi:hypothetical protein
MTDAIDPRDATEEAAASGRFAADNGTYRDESSPVEPAVPADEVDDDDAMRPNEAMPFERDLPGVEVTSPADQRRDPGDHQADRGLDRGVDAEHLHHQSQGARPERR